MQINLVAIGRMKKGGDTELYHRYLKRFQQNMKLQGFSFGKIIEFNESQRTTSLERKREEAEKLLPLFKCYSFIILLDEKGKQLSSSDFADFLAKERDLGIRSVLFVIGGADGIDQILRQEAHFTLSLSQLTLPHQLARILLLEQLYRSMMILAHHPYHRQ